MSVDDSEHHDERATRSTRRSSGQTEQIIPETESQYGDPVRQNWRSNRATGRTRRNQTLPSSRQELVLWLQHGGWRIVAAVSAVVIILLFLIVLLRPKSTQNQTAVQPTSAPFGQTISQTTSAAIVPTIVPTPQSSTGAQFRVTGTDTDGLFLRPDHSSDSQAIKTLPEGTVVTVVGDDFSGSDRVWKHVRDTEGAEGWVAVDFLKPVQ